MYSMICSKAVILFNKKQACTSLAAGPWLCDPHDSPSPGLLSPQPSLLAGGGRPVAEPQARGQGRGRQPGRGRCHGSHEPGAGPVLGQAPPVPPPRYLHEGELVMGQVRQLDRGQDEQGVTLG